MRVRVLVLPLVAVLVAVLVACIYPGPTCRDPFEADAGVVPLSSVDAGADAAWLRGEAAVPCESVCPRGSSSTRCGLTSDGAAVYCVALVTGCDM